MSDTTSVTDTSSDAYDQALDETLSTIGQQALLVSQDQMNDLRDRFKEALDEASE